MGQTRAPETLRQILVGFAMRTSLRGIPQIIRAKGWMRLMWLCCVTALFTGCLVNLTEIVRQYLQFDTIHQPKSRLNQSATFPSFTLCNQNPFSRQGRAIIRDRSWPTPREFWRSVHGLLREQGNRSFDPYKSSVMSHLHYWTNLPDPLFNYTHLGYSADQLITKCYALVLKPNEEPPVGHRLCEDIGAWRRIDHPDHLNCYMHAIRPEFASKVIYTEMRVFLDYTATEAHCIDCMAQNVNTQAWGARVVLHEQGSYPDISKDGFNVLPGTLTEVKIVPNAWHRLESPWGQCRAELPAVIRVASDEKFAYSSQLCDSLRKQLDIVARCGCYTATLPAPHGIPASVQPCEAFGSVARPTMLGLEQAANASRCFNGIAHSSTASDCGEPCFRYTYETTVSQAAWPRHSFHLDFAGSLKRGDHSRQYEEISRHYDKIKLAMGSARKGSEEPSEAAMRLHSSDLLSRSFLTVKIAKKDHFVRVIEEKAVRTLPSTLSQVGGLFSMWIGVTLIWIVEMIDLAIQIACYFCRGNSRGGGGGGCGPTGDGDGGDGGDDGGDNGNSERAGAEDGETSLPWKRPETLRVTSC